MRTNERVGQSRHTKCKANGSKIFVGKYIKEVQEKIFNFETLKMTKNNNEQDFGKDNERLQPKAIVDF